MQDFEKLQREEVTILHLREMFLMRFFLGTMFLFSFQVNIVLILTCYECQKIYVSKKSEVASAGRNSLNGK